MGTQKLARKARTADDAPSSLAAERAIVRDIEQRLRTARNDLHASTERNKIAFDAIRGDQRAGETLADLGRREQQTQRRISDLERALAEAKRRTEAAQAAETTANAAARLERAQQLAQEYIDESAEFDAALGILVAVMDARTALRAELHSTGCVKGDDMEKLRDSFRIQFAIRFARASSILHHPEWAGPSGCSSLAEYDRQTLSHLLPPF